MFSPILLLDPAIRDPYGRSDFDLGHDFIEVETRPENDRVRYTISPAARKEVLKRLLAEKNHRRAAVQAEADPAKPKAKRGRTPKGDDTHGDLFD
jgi:DNA-binding PadR family transcriptional regulator